MLFRSVHNGHGYFKNDDRCSGGRLTEDDTLACAHCQAGLLKRGWAAAGGFKCVHCDQPLCPRCASEPLSLKCEGPYEKRLQRALDEQYRREQNAKVLGI